MQRRSRSTATTRCAPLASSARVSPPGPGPTSTTVDSCERAGRARDARREIEVEQEVLAERLARRQLVAPDHLAQRRQVVDRAHRGATAAPVVCGAANRAARRSAAIRLVGSARPVPAMSNAVPWSGEVRTSGRPSVTLTA